LATHDADFVIRYRLGLSPEQRIQHARGEVSQLAADHVEDAVIKAEQGLPLAYAVGKAEFAGEVFKVTPAVLIPRPETEFLVQRAADYIDQNFEKNLTLLDLGCGSGCVGLTLAQRFPRLRVTLTDVSPGALDVARDNARRMGLSDRCDFRTGDWFKALKRRERFDIVLCNPPYITRTDDPQLEHRVREHEPSLALFLHEDPTDFYFRLGRKGVSHLLSGGLFAVEVGYDTAWPAKCGLDKVNALNRGKGIHDFNGLERVIWGIRR
jgi:release factor glutamine methyltransferase